MQLLQLQAQDEADDLIEKENKAAKKDLKDIKAKCIQEEKDKIGNSKKLSIGKLVNKCPAKPACPDANKAKPGVKKKPAEVAAGKDLSDLLKEVSEILGAEGAKLPGDELPALE